jgi:hypothetical protein
MSPFPFHCVECDEIIEQAFNGVCNDCNKEEEE